jgi:hypothetical protein
MDIPFHKRSHGEWCGKTLRPGEGQIYPLPEYFPNQEIRAVFLGKRWRRLVADRLK